MDGRRVYLRPLAARDTELILGWRSDPQVASQLFSERPPTRDEHLAFLERLATKPDRVEFVIVRQEDDVPIGTIGLSGIDVGRGEAEYGILIGERSATGKGMAREASELILAYAFEELGLQRIVLRVFADNEPALGLYRRLGFRMNSDGCDPVVKDGVAREVVSMTIEREVSSSACRPD